MNFNLLSRDLNEMLSILTIFLFLAYIRRLNLLKIKECYQSYSIASFVEECPINLRVAYILRQTIVNCGRVWSNWETPCTRENVSRNPHIRLKDTLLSCSTRRKWCWIWRESLEQQHDRSMQIGTENIDCFRKFLWLFLICSTVFCVVVAVLLFT